MFVKVTRRFQVTIPQEIREKLGLTIGDTVDIRYADGKIVIEKVGGEWEEVMAETSGVWNKHPLFGKMKNSVEVVRWLRGKKAL
ncbi:MAG: AbrB/MazE/SpoVT family DNA-binding domain-containing protein [Candidatus Jordarchaeaceae archaeon]